MLNPEYLFPFTLTMGSLYFECVTYLNSSYFFPRILPTAFFTLSSQPSSADDVNDFE
jgi:hypothetical protein